MATPARAASLMARYSQRQPPGPGEDGPSLAVREDPQHGHGEVTGHGETGSGSASVGVKVGPGVWGFTLQP